MTERKKRHEHEHSYLEDQIALGQRRAAAAEEVLQHLMSGGHICLKVCQLSRDPQFLILSGLDRPLRLLTLATMEIKVISVMPTVLR